jgi:MFS family permease
LDSVSRRNVALLFVSRALRSFAAGFMGVIIGLYLLHGIGLSPIAIGALFAVGALSTPAISLLVGRLGDIYGRKTVLIIDMLTLPLGIAILLTTRNVYLLGLSMGLGGFGMAGGLVGGGVGASVAPVLTALLAENSDEKNRTTIYSINSQINTFAGAAGAAIISFASYRLLFEIGLTLSLLSVAFVLPVRERFRRDPLGNGRPATLSDTDKRFIKIFGYTGLLNGIGMGLVSPFLPIIFNQFFGMNSSQIGFLMSAGGIISGIGYSFSTYLARRLGLVNLIVLSRGIASTLTFLIPFSPSAAVASFLYVVSTPIRMISLPAQSSLQMSLIGEGSRATASGLNQAARQFPQAVSTLLTGFMISALPVYVPFGLAALFNYANSYLYLKFFSRLPGTKSQNGPQN